MEITYIEHSGFLIEWDTCYWLFDYYKGDIPALNPKKMLYIFVSHLHGDHYNPEIFKLWDKCQSVTYVLSSDIKIKKSDYEKYGLTEEFLEQLVVVKPSQEIELTKELNPINLTTLKSTDSGVAFLLNYQGKTIYHAGDLNHWVWKEETKQYNNNMSAMFHQEMAKLKDISIDVAFAPLDPRQEEWYCLGLDDLLDTAKVSYVFPMHFWGKPEIITQYKQERQNNIKDTKIMDVTLPGQKWELNI